jgi:hypothetical protein
VQSNSQFSLEVHFFVFVLVQCRVLSLKEDHGKRGM